MGRLAWCHRNDLAERGREYEGGDSKSALAGWIMVQPELRFFEPQNLTLLHPVREFFDRADWSVSPVQDGCGGLI